ncbi:MAG: hypothetical protein JJU02_07290 [Cryomorphaceae bacterium]|nr:hypothetical protein [Cryomorphaceae bacterium]
MKFKYFALIIIMAVSSSAFSQYREGIGLRFGLPSGVSYKKFMNESKAYEIVLHLGGGLGVTGLYLIHAPAFDASGLQWYYGFGGHAHIYNSRYRGFTQGWRYGRADDHHNNVDLGFNGALGLEYTFQPVPLAISLDYMPVIGLSTSGRGYFGTGIGLGLRWTFRK